MKPSINFLRKCVAGEVGYTMSYSFRTGGQYRFRGGEKTYEKHLDAGYVFHATGASIGRPGTVELTEAGKSVLAAADAEAPK